MVSHLCIFSWSNLGISASILSPLLDYVSYFLFTRTLCVHLGKNSENTSVQFSCSAMSDSLPLHRLQHARPSGPSPAPAAYSNPCSCHPILCHPLLLLPTIPPSIRIFSNGSALWIRWPKYWSFSFNISPSNEHPRLISFRMDWLDLLAVQGTLKSLLQHHSSKASILLRSAFFIVQLSHPYTTT